MVTLRRAATPFHIHIHIHVRESTSASVLLRLRESREGERRARVLGGFVGKSEMGLQKGDGETERRD